MMHRRPELRHIGFSPDILARVIFPRSLMHHQFGGTHLRIGPRDRELHTLVLPDWTAEQLALLGVLRRLADEPFGVADALGRNQNALCIHADRM